MSRTENKPLIDIITEKLESNTLELPVFHTTAIKLQKVLGQPDFTIEQVANLIVADQALASQVLRMANSSFYSGLSKVATIRDAIVRLGAQEIANLVMMASQMDIYKSANPALNGYMQRLWKHALGCALGTKWLATKMGFRHMAQEAFLAGLLHDIGTLFLLKVLEEIGASRPSGLNLAEPVVMEILDNMHVEQGYRLMLRWNLPETYAEIVRDHHRDDWDIKNILLAMVRLANATCIKNGLGLTHEPSLVLAALPEVQVLGVKEILLAEFEIMVEDTVGSLPS